MSYPRRDSIEVQIGAVSLGGGQPIRVQSMTDTITADVTATVRQIRALADAGSELVRMAILNDADASALPEIHARLRDAGCDVPLVGDFHFNGHALLQKHAACAQALDKYRINPGNVGPGVAHDSNFERVLAIAGAHGKAIRIGANWGSLDARLRDRLVAKHQDWPTERVMAEAMLQSVLESAEHAVAFGFSESKLVLSAKASHVPTLLDIYRELARRTHQPLHVGLTEAGLGEKGIVSSAAALSVLLQEGIGDTLRVSITPSKEGADGDDPRIQEVVSGQRILQANGLRSFFPTVRSCPGCGRTNKAAFQTMVHAIDRMVDRHAANWRRQFPGSENLVIAVMGCVVNGIQEAQHADIGISLPGRTEDAPPIPMLFVDGRYVQPLSTERPVEEFLEHLVAYLAVKYSPDAAAK